MTARQKLATTEEVAEYLGKAVKTLWNWHSMNTGPRASKVGGHLRYKWADVEQWVDQQSRAAA
jgi:predicted DNA-binding transcriptional regulator AlpA